MKKIKIRRLFITTILCIGLSLICTGAVVYAETPDGSTSTSHIPEKLIIELGPDWAGSEFELVTDMGKYPGIIEVDGSGRLTMELGGSKEYTLSRVPVSFIAEPAGSNGTEQPSDDAGLPENESKSESVEENNNPATGESEVSGIPTLHLVLFICGASICVIALVLMRVFRTRRAQREAEEDDDY